jgi:L-alanine-DL-glutamate epimerase-like enolase superfamily enzyme
MGACRAIADVIQHPRLDLPAWYVVGIEEPLSTTLVPAIMHNGYSSFKLKLTGRDNERDISRTIEVYHTASGSGARQPYLTIDTNEANPSAESVLDFLEGLKAADRDAYDAVAYLEQPTSRDIRKLPFDWRAIAQYVPVMLDEGLTDLDVLAEAQRQGYSGLALKTCKGHSMLLVCAAWARQHGMLISLQDLTNSGIALIHAALVGAHLPTINGAELNSPQFIPAANEEFAKRLPELFKPRNGIHRLPQEIPTGLGSHL